MTVMSDIYQALGGPWELAAQIEDTPTRLVPVEAECSHLEPDDNTMDGIPCGWAGIADVAVFDDTEECLWWCPEGHENSLRWPL